MKFFAFSSWLIGAAVAVYGVRGDQRNLWTDRPFAASLIASYSAACFGLPIALFVISAFNAEQAAIAETQVATRSAADTLDRLKRLACQLPDL